MTNYKRICYHLSYSEECIVKRHFRKKMKDLKYYTEEIMTRAIIGLSLKRINVRHVWKEKCICDYLNHRYRLPEFVYQGQTVVINCVVITMAYLFITQSIIN